MGKHKENWVVNTRQPRNTEEKQLFCPLDWGGARGSVVSSDWLLEGWELHFCMPGAMVGSVRSQSLLISRV